MNHSEACSYIAAFIDGEGHIGCHITARHRHGRTIEFSNTDKQLFDRVIEITKIIGLDFLIAFRASAKPGWADRWSARLAGGRSSYEKFRDIIPIQAERKKKALDELIDSYVENDRLEEIYGARRTSLRVDCPQCAKPFLAFPADIKRNRKCYCSRECYAVARSTKATKVCLTCKAKFHVSKYREETARFCSQRCSGISRSEEMRAQASRAARVRWGHEAR
jgi:hypothetical protein